MTDAPARLRKPDRQSRIVAALRAAPALRIHELSALLLVSPETVRRDLTEMDQAGLINRTYGGATRAVGQEPGIAVREGLMVAERRRIAEAAVALIAPDDVLMIGGGATTLHFARLLAERCNGLTIITHGISIAAALAANPTHKVLILPGQYDGREGQILGPDTIEALHRFHANKAVLGASGLTDEGPNDAGLSPGQTYGTMMLRAAETLILADHGKFAQTSLTVYGRWSAATTLVTDCAPTGALAQALSRAGAGLVVANPNPAGAG